MDGCACWEGATQSSNTCWADESPCFFPADVVTEKANPVPLLPPPLPSVSRKPVVLSVSHQQRRLLRIALVTRPPRLSQVSCFIHSFNAGPALFRAGSPFRAVQHGQDMAMAGLGLACPDLQAPVRPIITASCGWADRADRAASCCFRPPPRIRVHPAERHLAHHPLTNPTEPFYPTICLPAPFHLVEC